MKLVQNWVEDNFESLYGSKPLQEKFVKMTIAVRKKKPNGMSEDTFRRAVFKNTLLNFISDQVITRRKILRNLKLAELLKQLDPSCEVVARETFLDRQVEKLGSQLSPKGETDWEKNIVVTLDEVYKNKGRNRKVYN